MGVAGVVAADMQEIAEEAPVEEEYEEVAPVESPDEKYDSHDSWHENRRS